MNRRVASKEPPAHLLNLYVIQTATFDAERQSFYDNEQHLKSRIQSLIQARKAQAQTVLTTTQDDDHVQSDAEDQAVPELRAAEAKPIQVIEDEEENEPAEMTALRLELSTLSTSYSSLQTTVQHLSSQLLDLKRVNNQLQEENESYNILLREKTLNGQFDILRTVGTRDSDDDDDMAEDVVEKTDRGSLRSLERTPLDPVDEAVEDMDSTLLNDDQSIEDKTTQSSRPRERNRRQGRGRRADSSHSPTSKGESLADLPITGPGLDLAAELGRAENLAILEGRTQDVDDRDRSVTNGSTKTKRSKRVSTDKKLPESSSHGNISASGSTDVDALRNEVKSLKDANRALSLYASKIIDRIIAQEGFEHVLAVDYENNVQTKQKPATKTAQPKPAEEPPKKTRPQSAIVFPRSSPGSPPDPQQPNASPVIPSEPTATSKSQRRSLSFDWKSFSVFGGGGASTEKDKKDNNPNLRPLNLRPGAAVVGARKLDTQEDEDDRRERERMNAVLKLMGIEKPEQPISPIVTSPTPTGSGPSVFSSEPTSPKPQGSRFSFFRSRSTNSDNSNSNSANNSTPNMNLTQEALERAEAETSLAALDEREKILSAEISKGASGGFTELPRRSRGEEWRSKRSRKSGESGSGSTVWSAGMSTHREADSDNERTQDRNDA